MADEQGPGRTRETAIVRPGARVILLDAEDRVLLIRSEWDGRWLWFTPGGALDGDETAEACARREMSEETGLEADEATWGPCVWRRRWVWYWAKRDTWYDTREDFFVARLDRPGPPIDTQGADDEEILALGEARWWRLEDLRASAEPTSPVRLATLLEPVIDGDYPDPPLEIAE